jgi:hypothetical protein
MVAEVLHVVTAKPAIAVDAADPGDADARADGEGCGCAFNYFADDLMARNDARMKGLEVALDNVEIGAADAAGDDFDEDFAGLRVGTGDIFDGKPGAGGGCGVKDGCAHGESPLRIRVARWRQWVKGRGWGTHVIWGKSRKANAGPSAFEMISDVAKEPGWKEES